MTSEGIRPENRPEGYPGSADPRDGRGQHPPRHIVFLDPYSARPVSQYSPEGEIRMMGDFARGLSRNRAVSKPMILGLLAIILLPIIVSFVAVLASW
ncbi:MAG: hypothetical protein JWN95_3410 [Frankiales bacterium]|nr:hypothetical protein [Frankiales bacterium]